MSANDIARATELCQSRLHLLLDSNEVPKPMITWLEQQQMLLDLWASVLGVFAEGPHSIVYRLRKNIAFAQAILQLMRNILSNLNSLAGIHLKHAATLGGLTAVEISSQGPNSGVPGNETAAGDGVDSTEPGSLEEQSSGSDSSESSSVHRFDIEDQAERLQQRVSEDVEDLLQFATILRQQGSAKQKQRAQTYEPSARDFDSDDEHDGTDPVDNGEQQTMCDRFESFAQAVLNREMGPEGFGMATKSYLKERLLQMMMKKWRRICYNHGHAKRLRGQSDTATQLSTQQKKNEISLNPSASAFMPSQIAARLEQMDVSQTKIYHPPRTFSQSAATTLPLDLPVLKPQRLKSLSSKSTARVDDIDTNLPPPPLMQAQSKGYLFVCPYCGLPQEVARRTDQKAWKLHLWDDLTPYVCLHERCQSADTEYGSVHEWKAHMLTHEDSTWTCSQCVRTDPYQEEAGAVSCHSEQELRTHYAYFHSDKQLGQTELSIIVQYSRNHASIKVCLVCGSDIGIVRPGETADNATMAAHNENLFACMSTHLDTLALSCLPWQLGTRAKGVSSEAQGSDNQEDLINEQPLEKPDPEVVAPENTLHELKSAASKHASAPWQAVVQSWSEDITESTTDSDSEGTEVDSIPVMLDDEPDLAMAPTDPVVTIGEATAVLEFVRSSLEFLETCSRIHAVVDWDDVEELKDAIQTANQFRRKNHVPYWQTASASRLAAITQECVQEAEALVELLEYIRGAVNGYDDQQGFYRGLKVERTIEKLQNRFRELKGQLDDLILEEQIWTGVDERPPSIEERLQTMPGAFDPSDLYDRVQPASEPRTVRPIAINVPGQHVERKTERTHGPVVCKDKRCGRTFDSERDLAIHLSSPHYFDDRSFVRG